MTSADQRGSVAVVGTTSWGTTLALLLARRGMNVVMLARTPEEADRLESEREHPSLPGQRFPETLHVTDDWHGALADPAAVLFVVPSRTLRQNALRAAPHIAGNPVVISACKGLEWGTFKRMSTVLAEELPDSAQRLCVLSGPNIAGEVVRGLPASTVIASENADAAEEAQLLFNSSTFRAYTNSDVIGTEIAGAMKNVIAIAAGISDGMALGDNAKASLLTRGLAEIIRLGVAAGANPATFAGNAGIGDLAVTCYSNVTRNHRVGVALGNGLTLDQALESLGGQVAEGVVTTPAALDMATALGVDAPIAEATAHVLFDGASPQDALLELMARAPRRE